jgi:hypothetical protein
MKNYVCAAVVAACLATPHVGAADTILDTIEEDCSTSVLIKVPYSSSVELDQGDILLGKIWQDGDVCGLINSTDPLQITGVCQYWENQTTNFSMMYSYSEVANASRYVRWVCGSSLERLRCPVGTKRIRFRLMDGGAFQAQCLDIPYQLPH